ncbi:hypothetical protein FA13DRAFT_1650221 [Coprinellus micaceus]|uniref:Uncharacterized protein n=1 Tax=Coprinellus micaceus TaxID=71717 RepID=A0A4Y7S7N8_COPMI|nr:hypothetical protein FA13DRAFT_1650221 [Coprinellus micaceus]
MSLTEERKQLQQRINNRDARKKVRQHHDALQSEEVKASGILGVARLKEKGVITMETRRMVRRLGKENVPDAKIDAVIHIVGEGLGVEVDGHIDPRSVGRIIAEGGIASEIQIVDELKPENCEGFTFSADGTAIRHRTFESHHVTMLAPSYESDNEERTFKTRLFGITNAVDHKSETQLQGIKTVSGSYYALYNMCTLGIDNPVDYDTFAALMDGLGSDHAEDMKKLARLLEVWKVDSKKILRGKAIWSEGADAEGIALLAKAGREAIDALGGLEAFNGMSREEQEKIDEETVRTVWKSIGGKAWDEMTMEERETAGRFVYAGCCMHKELNSVKGGDKALRAYWATVPEAERPVKLMNSGLTVAAKAGAVKEAEEHATGGATKLTSLAGMIFKHKDDKKGQQDFYRMFFEEKLGYAWRFPDTSNTRFQSHCAASAELIVHLPLYLQFLLVVRDKKKEKAFNHLESNVFKGLKDVGTLTEMSVFAFYEESLSKKYMEKVRRGASERANALDLGPLHDKVKAHCRKIIADPQLLLRGDEDDYKGATLDGTPWDRPDVIYAIHRLSKLLPHLEQCIKVFFSGALETWERLTSEYAPDGAISKLSTAERDRIFINATNNHNEGSLGTARIAVRRSGNIATRTISAKTMYARNGTEGFIQKRLPRKKDWGVLMKEARRRDASGINRRQRHDEIAQSMARIENERHIREENLQKKKVEDDRIANLTPVLDLAVLQKNVKDQLKWHRRINPTTVLETTLTNKMHRDELLIHLISVVKSFKTQSPTLPEQSQSPATPQRDQNVEMSWEEREELLDAAMDEVAIGADSEA